MKNKLRFSIAVVMTFFLATIVCCGPSKAEREEAARQDSIRIADSIAHAEEEARIAAIEAARQDSLAKIENFKKSIPPFREIYLHLTFEENKYHKTVNLEELGFTKNVKREKWMADNNVEMETDDVSYLLEIDPDHYCLTTEGCGYESKNWTFKIVGFPELMDQYKQEAKALRSSPDFTKYSFGPSLEIKKNEIFWVDGV